MNTLYRILFICCCVLFINVQTFASNELFIPYTDFVQMVESGVIKSVALDTRSKFHGVLYQDGQTVSFRSYRPTDTAGDPLLIYHLKTHHVDIHTGKHNQKSLFSAMATVGFITLTIPVVSLLFILLGLRHIKSIDRKIAKLLSRTET